MRPHKHQRAGIDHVRERARVIHRVGRNLRRGDVTGGLYERLELPVRHRRAVDPKSVDGYAMGWRFFRIVIVRSHAERAAADPNHLSGLAFIGLPFALPDHRRFHDNAPARISTP